MSYQAPLLAEIQQLRDTLALQQRSYEREIALDVAAERDRIKGLLLAMHAEANGSHNYYQCAVVAIFGDSQPLA